MTERAIPTGGYSVFSEALMLLACGKNASDPLWIQHRTKVGGTSKDHNNFGYLHTTYLGSSHCGATEQLYP